MRARLISLWAAPLLTLAACERGPDGPHPEPGGNQAAAPAQSGATGAIGSGPGPAASGPGAPGGGGSSCPQVVRESDAASAPPNQIRNRLTVGAGGTITWNGSPIDAVTLRQYLDISKRMNPPPTLVTRAEPGADAAAVQSVLDTIAAAMGCRPAGL